MKGDKFEKPYSLAFGFKATIRLEVELPTIWIEAYDDKHNSKVLAWDIDLAEKIRENALIRIVSYQQQLSKTYNQKVHHKEFMVGELVLWKDAKNIENCMSTCPKI